MDDNRVDGQEDDAIRQERDYSDECGIYFEHEISCFGYSYLIIFGYHINGAYICVPHWNWGCEATDVICSVEFNKEQLMKAGARNDVAYEISKYIDKWLQNNQIIVNEIRNNRNQKMLQKIESLKKIITKKKRHLQCKCLFFCSSYLQISIPTMIVTYFCSSNAS